MLDRRGRGQTGGDGGEKIKQPTKPVGSSILEEKDKGKICNGGRGDEIPEGKKR